MNTAKAIEICKLLEPIASIWGMHVALTGGCLYRGGERKDCDIVLYLAREKYKLKECKRGFLTNDAFAASFSVLNDYGRVVKVLHGDNIIDLMFPGIGTEFSKHAPGYPI